MKDTYRDIDGTYLELTWKEFVNRPFNSRLTLIRKGVKEDKTIKKTKVKKHGI